MARVNQRLAEPARGLLGAPYAGAALGGVAAVPRTGFGCIRFVGSAAEAVEAAVPRHRSAGIWLRVGGPPRMSASGFEAKLLAGIVLSFLATTVFAAESGSGAGHFWAAVLVLAGPALGGLAVCTLVAVCRRTTSAPWAIGSMASWRWSGRARVFARADIASVLVPLIDHAGLQGRSTIQIVGSDGGYLTGAKKKGLLDAIRKWVKAGHEFRYILVAPSNEAVAELEALKEQICGEDEASSERLEILQLGGKMPGASATNTPADIQLLARILHTCHPTLIWSENSASRAMWIEGNHPPGEEVSYDNQWVPPAAMSQSLADLPNQTWSDVFSAWDGKLRRLCEYSREQMAVQ